jgi:hypothetical protein
VRYKLSNTIDGHSIHRDIFSRVPHCRVVASRLNFDLIKFRSDAGV